MATKMRPCIVLYMATGNLREKCKGFCIASFLKLHSGNNALY